MKDKVIEFLNTEFPQSRCVLEELGEKSSKVRYPIGFDNLRPGGTVSGPTLFALADFALYVALLGEIGIVPLAVTSNITINFLRKPAAERDLVGNCQLLKVGRTLATGEVYLYSEGQDEPVAHVVGTYAIPSAKT